MRKSVALVSQTPYFAEYRTEVARRLAEVGFVVDEREELPRDREFDVVFVIGIHNYQNVPHYRRSVLVGVQTEQIPLAKSKDARLNRNASKFRSVRGFYRTIIDWNPSLYAADVGGDVFIPYGCPIRSASKTQHTYDICFIGNIGNSPRRHRILEVLKDVGKWYPDYSPGFGQRKTEAIRSSRILLNIHFYEDGGVESPRLFDYCSHGAFVLSESSTTSFPFSEGHDFVSFHSAADCREKIQFYLSRPDERRRIADNAYATSQAFSYRHTAELVELELQRALSSPRRPALNALRWCASQSATQWFQLRDRLSVARRRFLNKKNAANISS